MRLIGLALALGAVAVAPAAQTEAGGVQTVCRLPIASGAAAAVSARRSARPEPCPVSERTADFEVSYSGFPPNAEAAFQAAVDTWACRIHSGQPIRIDASWTALDRGTLGSAGPFLLRNFDEAPSRDVWYPSALADHLAGRDLGGGDPDIEASFNSDFALWHFSLTTPPSGAYDLYTVVLHEIGHGLGLIGAMTVEEGRGFVGIDPEGPYVYDLLAEDAGGTALLDAFRYPDGSVALASVLRSEVFVSGLLLDRVVGEAPLYTPDRWVQGGSYSHFDEDAFPQGEPDGLMTPFIGRDEVIDEPGPVTCAALGDLGWPLAGACAQFVGAPVPTDDGLTVERRGPNPFSSQTTLRLQSETPRLVRVEVYDVLGRRVLDLGSTALVALRPSDVIVDAGALASGVYVARVLGGGRPLAVPLTVVR